MLTPLEIQQKSETLEQLYIELEQELLNNIADQLNRHSDFTETAKWQMDCLANMGSLNKKNLETIKDNVKVAPELLQYAIDDAAYTSANRLDERYSKLAEQNLIGKTQKDFMTPHMKQIMQAFEKQGRNSLNLVNSTMLAKSNEAYSNVVNDVYSQLNLAAAKAIIGAESYQQAVRKSIMRLADKGVTGFVDKSGRNWSAEAYVNTVVRSTVNNTANQVQFNYMDMYGVDLLQVSQHMGARPKCAVDQGKVFSRSGKSEKYPPWSSSSYGQADGVLGVNCRHSIFEYFDGLSKDAFKPINEKENKRIYELNQHQRLLERKVRKAKAECSMLNKLGDAEGFEKSSVKLKRQEYELKQFVAKHKELTYQGHRAQVVGFDKSVSQKAVHTANTHYNKWKNEIGADIAPKKLEDYYKMKYNNNEKYKELIEFSKYKKLYGDVSLNEFHLNKFLRQNKLIKGNICKNEYIHPNILEDIKAKDPAHIMKRMKERNISDDELYSFVKDALFCESQYKGSRKVYYSEKGVAVITKTKDYDNIEWIAKTTWSKSDYDLNTIKILEAVKKYV